MFCASRKWYTDLIPRHYWTSNRYPTNPSWYFWPFFNWRVFVWIHCNFPRKERRASYHSKKFLNRRQGFPVRAPILSWGWFSSTDRLQRPSSSIFPVRVGETAVAAPKVWIKRWFHLVFPTSTTRTLGVMGVLQRSIYHMVIMPTGEKSICPLFFALWSQDFSKCSTIFWKINDRFLTSKLQADDQFESTADWTLKM